jgi:cytidylate kinase
MNQKTIIIAIDGHSSCGKSTVAKTIAKQLGFVYIDTGAMYRAVTLYCLQEGIIVNGIVNESLLFEKLSDIKIDFKVNPETALPEVMLNGKVVESEIRGMNVSEMVSPVSKLKIVRNELVPMQRNIAAGKSVVMDGRDIGTVVFPNADLKIFMTADPKVRAQRRFDELTAKGEGVNFDQILKNVVDRDYQDENRAESPLQKASDALLLDNSFMTREEQLQWIITKVI